MKAGKLQYYHEKYHTKAVMLALCMLLLVITSPLQASSDGDPHRYRESGELSTIEQGDKVVIDAKGYATDPSVLVVNVAGRPISLKDLSLPVHVNFEWVYVATGPKTMRPVVVYIEESQEKHNETRSAQ
jgi:hypothetical protein